MLRTSLRRVSAILCFILLLSAAALAEQMTAKDILQLKKMGFTDAEVKAAVARSGGKVQLSPDDIQALKAAGAGDELIAAIQGAGPASGLSVADVVKMLKAGKTPAQVLDSLAAASPRPVASAAELADLKRQDVPLPVVLALSGKPLGVAELKQLGESHAPLDVYQKLSAIVGFDTQPLSIDDALALGRAGVPAEAIALYRAPRAPPATSPVVAIAPATAPATKPVKVVATDAPLIAPDTREYRHLAHFFALRFPKDWHLSRELTEGASLYAVTPEAGRSGWKSMDVSVAVMLVPLPANQPALITVDPVFFLKQELPSILLDSPKLATVGEVVPAKLGKLPGAKVVVKGTPKDMSGNFVCDIYAARERDMMILAQITLEEHKQNQRDACQKVLDNSDFGRAYCRPGPASRPSDYTLKELVDKYMGSVVLINAASANFGASGTGFIISKDGYVATNAHVALDDHGKVCETFTARWDQSLNRKPLPLTYIGHRFEGEISFMHWGYDVALFKLPAGEYAPCPIGSLDDMTLGDPIVVMGFPKSFSFIDPNSITVTEGTISRMNRNIDGAVDSIFHTAKSTHGNSGGPTFSRRTGQVVAQLTYGPPSTTGLDEQSQTFRDLAGLNGSIPVDRFAREFPLVTDLGLTPDAPLDFQDSYALARLFTARGSHHDALLMSQRAVKLDPKSAEAHGQLASYYLSVLSGPDELEKAIKSYNDALACDPKYAEALTGLAGAYLMKGDAQTALTWADRAVLDQNSFVAHLIRGSILLALKKPDEALAAAEKAKELVRDLLPEPYILAGTIRYAKNDLDGGKAEFEHASRIAPRSLPARMGVGQFFEIKKDYDGALAEYRRIDTDIPGHPTILTAQGRCLMAQQKYEDAGKAYWAAYSECGKWKMKAAEEVFINTGMIRQREHNTSLALNWYAAFLGAYPNSPMVRDVHVAIAKAVLEQNSKAPPDVALPHLMRSAKLKPGEADVKQLLEGRRWNGLTVNAIAYMLYGPKYPVDVLADLIAETPLAFDPQAADSKQALAEAKIDVKEVLAAIDASAKQFHQGGVAGGGGGRLGGGQPPDLVGGGGGGGGQPPPERQPERPAALVGTWEGMIGNMRCVFVLEANGHFVAQGTQRDEGTWSVNGALLIFTNAQGGQVGFEYQADGNSLQLRGPNGAVTLKKAR